MPNSCCLTFTSTCASGNQHGELWQCLLGILLGVTGRVAEIEGTVVFEEIGFEDVGVEPKIGGNPPNHAF